MEQGWFTELSLNSFLKKHRACFMLVACLCLGKSISLGCKALSVQPVTYRLRGNFSKDICAGQRMSCGYIPLNYLTHTFLA